MNGNTFSEIIVDYSAGMITQVDVITDRGDLAAARGQKEAMARATRTLETATAEAVRANSGYRAVRAMPGLKEGRPSGDCPGHGPQFCLPTAAIPVTLRVRFVTIHGGADMRYPSRNLKLVRLNGQSITGEPTS